MKKGQVTIFIILMLMVLSAFGLIFYIATASSMSDSKQQTKISTQELVSKSSIEKNIKSCLDDSVIIGLNLIGKQGGFIYQNQWINSTYGPIKIGSATDIIQSVNVIPYNGNNYTVWITAPTYIDGTSYSDDTTFRLNSEVKNFKSNYYPCTSVKKLITGDPNNFLNEVDNLLTQITFDVSDDADCLTNNAILITRFTSFINLSNPITELSSAFWGRSQTGNSVNCSTTDCTQTVQSRLERVVKESFKACFKNLTFYESNVNVDYNKLEVISFFTSQGVSFEILPKINVSSKDGVFALDIGKVSSTSVNLNLELLISTLAEDIRGTNNHFPNDAYYASYDLRANFESEPDFPNSKVIITDKIKYNNKYYNLVTIKIPKEIGNVDGKDYEFSFARENRLPVLSFTEEQVVTRDNVLLDNYVVGMTFCASDPDEDVVSISLYSKGPTIQPADNPTESAVINGIKCVHYSFIGTSADIGHSYNFDAVAFDFVLADQPGGWNETNKEYADYQVATIKFTN